MIATELEPNTLDKLMLVFKRFQYKTVAAGDAEEMKKVN